MDWGDVAVSCAHGAIYNLGISAALGLVTGVTSVIAKAVAGCIVGAGLEVFGQAVSEEVAFVVGAYLDAETVADVLYYLSAAR